MTSTPKIELTLRLGRLAYEYGLPGYELNGLMDDIGRAMGLNGRVISTPTFLDYTVDAKSGTGQHRMMVTLGDVSYDLGKLSQTMRLADQMRTGSMSRGGGKPTAGRNRSPSSVLRFRPVVGVAHAACGAGFAVILSAAWQDVGLAAALSIVVFCWSGHRATMSGWAVASTWWRRSLPQCWPASSGSSSGVATPTSSDCVPSWS